MYFILFLTTVRCYIFERFFCFSWIRTPGKATGGSSHVTVWLQCTVQEKWSMVIGPLLCIYFNPLRFTVTFLYPLKTSGKRRFSDVFRGYKNVTLDINGFKGLLQIVSRFHIKCLTNLSEFVNLHRVPPTPPKIPKIDWKPKLS